MTVSFDGINAPIIFASFNAVLAQVPYELQGRSATAITVTFQNVSSSQVAKVVVAASPGLHTRGGVGVGVLTALNPNGSLNSPNNAVERGSFVTVYANGLGAVNPAVPTGQRAPASPLSVAQLPITASIGGQRELDLLFPASILLPARHLCRLQPVAARRFGQAASARRLRHISDCQQQRQQRPREPPRDGNKITSRRRSNVCALHSSLPNLRSQRVISARPVA